MAELLADPEIEAALLDLQAWARDGESITRTFDRGDFDGAIAFVNTVAAVARALDHHPDIAVSWNEVTLTLSTHSAKGVTQKDIDLACKIDAAANDRSGAPSGAGAAAGQLEKSYRLILASGDAVPIDTASLERLKETIASETARWELYLVNEDGPYVVPANIVSIEIVKEGAGGVMSAEAVSAATMDVADLIGTERGETPEPA